MKQQLQVKLDECRQLESDKEQLASKIRRQLEQKQKEIERIQAKMVMPVDTDILRLKLQKDLEARHRFELEQKEQEAERLQEQFYEAKRQMEIHRTQFENLKVESEREVSDWRDKYRALEQEYSLEV